MNLIKKGRNNTLIKKNLMQESVTQRHYQPVEKKHFLVLKDFVNDYSVDVKGIILVEEVEDLNDCLVLKRT